MGIVDVSVKLPKSVCDFLFSGFFNIGRAPVYTQHSWVAEFKRREPISSDFNLYLTALL
jgi:hypothetical protein